MPTAKPISIKGDVGAGAVREQGGQREDEGGVGHRRGLSSADARGADTRFRCGDQGGAGRRGLSRRRVGRTGLLPRPAAGQADPGRGPAGVGKTELAKALSRASGRELIRLQCYEGLDEAKALYEWNYRKQLLRIQAGGESGWEDVHGDIFSEEFLLERPLMQAIASASRWSC